MPSINLIASQRQEKRRLEQYTHRLFYAIIAELGAILVVTSFMIVKLVTTRSHIETLNSQVSSLAPKVNQIQQLEGNTNKLKPKVTTLVEARNNTLYWYTALQTVNASLPDHAWLTNINTSGDPTPPKPTPPPDSSSTSSTTVTPPPASAPPEITFTGMAASSDQVGVAMMKMNQFTNISSVTLNEVNQNAAGEVKAMKFSMVVLLKPNTALDADLPASSIAPVHTASIADSDSPYSAKNSVTIGGALSHV